jgi:hypothetical protein
MAVITTDNVKRLKDLNSNLFFYKKASAVLCISRKTFILYEVKEVFTCGDHPEVV